MCQKKIDPMIAYLGNGFSNDSKPSRNWSEIKEIKDSSPISPKRLFPWLWRKLRDVLVAAKEDGNATAVDNALSTGPHAALLAEYPKQNGANKD